MKTARKFIDHFLIVAIPWFLGIYAQTLPQWIVLDFLGSWNERQLWTWGFVLVIAGYKIYTYVKPAK